jgi:hypothetical protein
MTQDIVVNAALMALDKVERQETALRLALESLKLSLFDVSEQAIKQRHEAKCAVEEALQ